MLPTSRRRPAQAQGPAEHPGEGSTYVPVPLRRRRRRRRLPGSLPDGAARPRPPQQRHRRRRGGGSSGPARRCRGDGAGVSPRLNGEERGKGRPRALPPSPEPAAPGTRRHVTPRSRRRSLHAGRYRRCLRLPLALSVLRGRSFCPCPAPGDTAGARGTHTPPSRAVPWACAERAPYPPRGKST